MTPAGPKVLEYNVRFGDPETQRMMLLLAEETDLAAVLLACTDGKLDSVTLAVRPGYACNVIIAAGGYPGAYESGDTITIGELPRDVHVFHAGTKLVDGDLKTAGGRVVSVAALGDSLEQAVEAAYRGVDAVSFKHMYYRRDIARR
ncbi:Uncharacterized protein TPAR_02601 [Tolypocladium paradoxum]|uniref:Glycinamide ribonucleotide synthetase n=1 Tax=Tolypocladium paradoxum TaxID=94208 RepID=A0A2S4L424_9HYPO|nr:Uncharacterized protein TPAR_02601 [Tolypocladium paradoxum]